MGAPSANSGESKEAALKAGFHLTPPVFLNRSSLMSAHTIGSVQQRLVLNFPNFSLPAMCPFVLCDNTRLAIGKFQELYNLPATGEMCHASWNQLFLNAMRCTSITLKPNAPSIRKYVLLSPPYTLPSLVAVTQADPLKLTLWGVTVPDVDSAGKPEVPKIQLNADWNEPMDGFDVSIEYSPDWGKVYTKLGFQLDQVIPTLTGTQTPSLAGGVEVKLPHFLNLSESSLSFETDSKSVQLGLSEEFELFRLKFEMKQVLNLSPTERANAAVNLKVTW